MQHPNILFIMSDDHAAHAMSCYRSRINRTPGLDRIAQGGMRFDSCFCTNSICAPSRAAILTGTYNHVNGVTTLATKMDNRLQTFPKLLQAAGYQTAMVGKWHLGQGPAHEPTGFDYWCALPGQGLYHDPEMIEMGEKQTVPGYVTDLITDRSLAWLKQRDPQRPFCLLCHHKAPHRPWEPAPRHVDTLKHTTIAEPETLYDTYRKERNLGDSGFFINKQDKDLFRQHAKELFPLHHDNLLQVLAGSGFRGDLATAWLALAAEEYDKLRLTGRANTVHQAMCATVIEHLKHRVKQQER